MSFDITNTKDRNLFAKVLDERINLYGLSISYMRVDRDAEKDSLYLDDTKPLISARYDMKVHGTTMDEISILTRFGIEDVDETEVILSKNYFEETVGDDERPNEGDFIKFNYSGRLFQIADVKDDEGVFLEYKFAYKLLLQPADISGEEVTPNIGIEDYEDEDPLFNDGTSHIVSAADFIIEKPGDIDPFGDWE